MRKMEKGSKYYMMENLQDYGFAITIVTEQIVICEGEIYMLSKKGF